MRSLRLQTGKQSATRLMLDPPELGKIHVRVSVAGDQVEIGVETEKAGAREIISERAMKLRTSLEEQGWVVGRIHVAVNERGLFDPRLASTVLTDRPSQVREGEAQNSPRTTTRTGSSLRTVRARRHENVGDEKSFDFRV